MAFWQQLTVIFMVLSDDYFSLCLFALDFEPSEEVLETGNGHGGGKTYFLNWQMFVVMYPKVVVSF